MIDFVVGPSYNNKDVTILSRAMAGITYPRFRVTLSTEIQKNPSISRPVRVIMEVRRCEMELCKGGTGV